MQGAIPPPMPVMKTRPGGEEGIMRSSRSRNAALLTLLVAGALLVVALVPASALAAWTSVDASIVDSLGTGVVPVLNVSVANRATNDASPVQTVQFSDDGQEWYAVPYTGEPCDWVLAGEAGHKTLYVRFGAADSSVSPVVTAEIDLDTAGPATEARAARAKPGGRVAFTYRVRDPFSPRVDATLVLQGRGFSKRFRLGRVATGKDRSLVKVKLPTGAYSWSVEAVDLGGREQESQNSARFVIR